MGEEPLINMDSSDRYEREREAMVKYQLQSRGIVDERVLEAMRKVPRHLFVDEMDRPFAYEDRPLSIGEGQTISQPYMVALMTQILWLKGEEKVLEIGTGSGYQAAILAELSREVHTIERIPELLVRAQKVLRELGYTNIHLHLGDGTLGWPDEAPYDRIIVTAGAPRIPQTLLAQLASGGRMVIPIGGRVAQELHLVLKQSDGTIQTFHRGGCVFVPLLGREGWQDVDVD